MGCGKNNDKLVSPLRKAKGLGASHSGTHHWMLQRITAITNIPLVFWAVYSIFSLQNATYTDFTTWLSLPWNTVLAILFVLSTFKHAVLGSQVIMEDYISCSFLRRIKVYGLKLFMLALGVATIIAILKIALGVTAGA